MTAPDELKQMLIIKWDDVFDNVKGSKNDYEIKKTVKDYVVKSFWKPEDGSTSGWIRLRLF